MPPEINLDVLSLFSTVEKDAFYSLLHFVESNQSNLSAPGEELSNLLSAAEWARAEAEPLALVRFLKGVQPLFEIRGLWQPAESLSIRAIQHGREMGNHWILATAYLILGRLLVKQRRYSEARSYLDQSMAIWEILGDQTNLASCLTELGEIAFVQDQRTEARLFYEQASRFLRQSVARDFLQLGVVSQTQGALELAGQDFQSALEAARAIQDQRFMAEALRQLGYLEFVRGNYDTARNYYQESNDLAMSVGDKVGLKESLYFLALIRMDTGDHNSAKDLLNQGLNIAKELRDTKRVSDFLFHLADIALTDSDYQAAHELYESVIQTRRMTNDPAGLQQALYGLAKSEIGTRKLSEAEMHLRESFGLAHQIGDHNASVKALLAMGDISLQQGSIFEARIQWQRALQQAQARGLAVLVDEAHSRLLQVSSQ